MSNVEQPYRLAPIYRGNEAFQKSDALRFMSAERVFDWTQDLTTIAKLCRDPAAIARASGFAAAQNDSGGTRVECAVYVIGVEGLPVSKIGISACPIKRFDGLQAVHWSDLVLHGIIWCPSRKAGLVEQTALKAAEEMGCRLRGEWVAMEPEEAFETVLKAARFQKVPACDSQTWLSNWNARMHAMAKAKRDAGRMRRAA